MERILGSELDGGLNKTADLHGRMAPSGRPGRSAPATARGREIAGIGRVLLWNGGSLWIGHSAGKVAAHSHHAIQLSFALGGEFRMQSPRRPGWRTLAAALVRPNHVHQFDGCGRSIAQVFCEPETVHGRALLALHDGGDVIELDTSGVRDAIDALSLHYQQRAPDEALVVAAQALTRRLANLAPAQTPATDLRIEWVIAELRAHAAQPIALAEAARWAHLSPSRFRHLFVAQTGTSFRAYQLWLRLNTAIEHAMRGATWTEAAHHAGFADSPHLTRTCRRMFGIVPAMLIRD